jgi:hypothetical protein
LSFPQRIPVGPSRDLQDPAQHGKGFSIPETSHDQFTNSGLFVPKGISFHQVPVRPSRDLQDPAQHGKGFSIPVTSHDQFTNSDSFVPKGIPVHQVPAK